MTRERWQMVRRILQSAMELGPEERSSFVDRECASDPSLREDVGMFLSVAGKLDPAFLESPVAEHVPLSTPTAEGDAILPAGTRLGRYELHSLLGAGGMGEVYRARDTRLNRTVAIKVIPRSMSTDSARLKRFEREARAIAALQHPNICTLHDIGRHDGTQFLVMEYLDGETLANRLQKGRLPIDRALRYGLEVTDALDAAHRAGVVHRDLKPANILLTIRGEAKVLDFGLAKLDEPEIERDCSSRTALDLKLVSIPGLVMGTVSYMSPEQACGQELDPRTDIFSLGAVLYEMLSGRMAFPGETSAMVHKAILEETPPPLSRVIPSLPKRLDRIVSKALEKDRDLRYQSAAELRADLEECRDLPEIAPKRGKAFGTVRRPILMWTAAALVIAAVFAAVTSMRMYHLRHSGSRLTEKDKVFVSGIDNNTGNRVFDDTLTTALSVSLNESPFLRLLSANEVSEILRRMGRSPGTKLTPELAQELCVRAGGKAYVTGSINALGSQFMLTVKAVNCENGSSLVQKQALIASKEKVLESLGGIAIKLRGELGESVASIQKFDVPLAEATTSSLEALKAYSLGEKLSHRGGWEPLRHYQRAIELDPKFASAYRAAAEYYADLSEQKRAIEAETKAFQLRDRTSDLERLNIEAAYYVYVTGELEKAVQVYRQELTDYPRQEAGYAGLEGVYKKIGLFDNAIGVAMQLAPILPDSRRGRLTLCDLYLATNRFDEARRTLQEAHARNPEDSGVHEDLYGLAFISGDHAGVAREEQWFAASSRNVGDGLSLASETEAYVGRFENSEDSIYKAIGSSIRSDKKENAALLEVMAAQREIMFGYAAKGVRTADDALRLSPGSPAVEPEAALAFAWTGATGRAESIVRDLETRFALDTQIQRIWLPAIRGQIALAKGMPAVALDRLGTFAAVELGNMQFLEYCSCLYNSYIRGYVYLSLKRPVEAEAEFQRIVDRKGVVWNCWTGALARLGVARARALQARMSHRDDDPASRAHAREAYEDFFSLWKDADPTLPILNQAKAEYAKVR